MVRGVLRRIIRRSATTPHPDRLTGDVGVSPSQGAAFLELLLSGHDWRHRRVDSVHLEGGDRGRWRTSIDCTIPGDEALRYGTARDRVVVPLALIDKGPMRDLDVVDDEGRPLPVLGAAEDGALALAALEFAFSADGLAITPALHEVLKSIVHGGAEESLRKAEALLTAGTPRPITPLSDSERSRITPASGALLRDLAASFVLIALVPVDRMRDRTLLKFSYYWRTDMLDQGWARIVAGAFGLRPVAIDLPVRGAGDAASYHLEVHTPAGLVSEELQLPSAGRGAGGHRDLVLGPVAHAHGRYPARPGEADDSDDARDQPAAWLTLGVARRGPKTVAALISLFAFMFFGLGVTLPGAMAVLRGESDPSGVVDPSALLLTLPAVLVGLIGGAREHGVASVLLMPIRTAAIVCSILLVVAAASLTFELRDPWFMAVWNASLVLAGAALGALGWGELARRRRGVRGLD